MCVERRVNTNNMSGDDNIVTTYIDMIISIFEMAFYFSLVLFVLNVVFYVTFMIGFELNVIQPIKQSASENNAVLQSEVEDLLSTYESDFTSYILYQPSDEVDFSLGVSESYIPRYQLYGSDNRIYVDKELEKKVDDYNKDKNYATLTSYTPIQQMQNFKLRLRIPIRVDILGFASFVYFRDFNIDIVAMDHHDHLPSYNTLKKGGNNKENINLPILGQQDFSYSYYLDNRVTNGNINNLIFSKIIE